MSMSLTPIGHIKSMFQHKNGTPRQSGLIKSARASLTINKTVFNNPEHSLEDISSFSHVWLIWVFHANGAVAAKAKVAPPRLKGRRVGVFSTRSPHRPCPIGLTLAKVERVQGATVHLSGIDLIDGTPVLDVKPYIPQYDSVCEDMELYIPQCDSVNGNSDPSASFSVGEDKEAYIPQSASVSEDIDDRREEINYAGCDDTVINGDVVEMQEQLGSTEAKIDPNKGDELKRDSCKVKVPEWVGDHKDDLSVAFTERSLKDIETFDESKLKWLESSSQLKIAITEILTQDPRSVYRRHQCSDRLYFTDVDTVHVTAWFDDRINTVEVLRVRLKHDE